MSSVDFPLSFAEGKGDDKLEPQSLLEEGTRNTAPPPEERNENTFHQEANVAVKMEGNVDSFNDTNGDSVGLRKRGTKTKNQEGKNALSFLSKKYDLTGKGHLDEKEQMLRDMDKGDGLDANEVYMKLNMLLKFQKKYNNLRFLLFFTLVFCAFILCSNLLMGVIASNLSKDMTVKGGTIVANNKEAKTIATTAHGTSAIASMKFMDIAISSEDRRLEDTYVERSGCAVEDFYDVAKNEYFRGSLQKSQCEQLHLDAINGARPMTITFQSDTTEASHVLPAFTPASYSGGGCTFHAFNGESEVWYLKSCEETDCDFFIVPKDEVPLLCCLTDIEQKLKQAGEPCACDDQCESSVCAGDDENSKTCLVDSKFEGYEELAQEAFNHQGELTELSPSLFNEIYKTFSKIIANVQNAGALSATDYNYMQYEQFADDSFFTSGKYKEHLFESDKTYRELRQEQEEEEVLNDIRFAKESGCLYMNDGSVDDGSMSDLEDFIYPWPCVSARKIAEDGLPLSLYKKAKGLDFGVVEKIGDICYGAFRGTTMKTTDWGQNFNLRTSIVGVENSELKCKVRRGFQRTFIDESELWNPNPEDNGMEYELRRCAEECVTTTGKKCTVILGGHSQGGALATVAAIYLRDLNPVVITSGAPPALYPMRGNLNLCPLINKDRYFRFVSAKETSFDLHYDPVPQATAFARHIGHEFRPVDTSSKSVAYFYNSKSPKVYLNDYGAFWVVHKFGWMEPYLFNPMKAHFDTSGESIQLGFENGIACNKHSECYSKRCKKGSRINVFGRGMTCESKAEDGDDCVMEEDCQSGRCDRENKNPLSKRLCQAKLSNGQGCTENSDCVSNRCDRKWKSVNPFDKICKGRLELGERCSESSDCLSERCDGNVWNKTCRARLANGESCNENTDCISEYCPGKWRRVCKDP